MDLEDLECRQELAEALGLKHVSHEDLSRHQCVDWLKAHETQFSRTRMMDTADLTGIPMRSVMGPINYRPLKLLWSPGLTPQAPNKFCQNQFGNSRAVGGSRQATGPKRDGTTRCRL